MSREPRDPGFLYQCRAEEAKTPEDAAYWRARAEDMRKGVANVEALRAIASATCGPQITASVTGRSAPTAEQIAAISQAFDLRPSEAATWAARILAGAPA